MLQLQHSVLSVHKPRCPPAFASGQPRSSLLRRAVRVCAAAGDARIQPSELWAGPEAASQPAIRPAAAELQVLQHRNKVSHHSWSLISCMSLAVLCGMVIVRFMCYMGGVETPNIAKDVFHDQSVLLTGAWLAWWAMFTSIAWRLSFVGVFYMSFLCLTGVMLPLAYCCTLFPVAGPVVTMLAGIICSIFVREYATISFKSAEEQLLMMVNQEKYQSLGNKPPTVTAECYA